LPTLRSRFVTLLVALGGAALLPLVVASLAEHRMDQVRVIGIWGALGSLLLVGLVGFGVWETFSRIRRLGVKARAGDETGLRAETQAHDEIAWLARALAGGLRKERAGREAELRRLADLTAQQIVTRRCTEGLNAWLAGVGSLDSVLTGIAAATGYARAELCDEWEETPAHDDRVVDLRFGERPLGMLVLSGNKSRKQSAETDALIDGFAQLLTIGCLARHLLDQQEKRRQLAAALVAARIDTLPADIGELLRDLIPHDRSSLRLLDEAGRPERSWSIHPGVEPHRSELEVELCARGDQIGTLELGRRTGVFGGQDREAARDLAPVLASAMLRMRLQTRLEEAERWNAMGAFARHLAHELKNPVNGLLLQLTLLERCCQRCSHDRHNLLRHAQAIREEAGRLLGLLDDGLAALPGAGKAALDNVDLGQVVSSALGALEETLVASGTVLESDLPEQPALVRADGGQLRRVVRELLDDALSRVNGSGERRIRVGLDRAGGDWSLAIDRPGLTAGDPEQLFVPVIDPAAAGTGLELALCRWVARALGGNVAAEHLSPHGLRLTLTLPAAGD
jgi:signal transduction histidine kinase